MIHLSSGRHPPFEALVMGASAGGVQALLAILPLLPAHIGRCGGRTVVQDPRQAQAPTMPQAALRRCSPELSLAAICELMLLWAQEAVPCPVESLRR